MGKIDSWITKIPRLKNSKVARFSYKAEAYANDNIEGVDSYDYSHDMNVPLATHTDFESSVLSTGARANFSSIPKNGLNHFFGRVSYNLNKVIDFLADLIDDFRIQGVETVASSVSKTLASYYSGKKLRLANTHATNSITFTFYAGQTYQGSNTVSIPAGRSIDIELIGTTWRDSLTGNLIGNVTGDVTGNVTGKAKDSYPISTDAVLQYSFDEIKQLPDNPAGTVYKKDNDWTTVDGWATGHATASVVENKLSILSSATNTAYILKAITATNKRVRVNVKRSNAGEVHLYGTIGGVFTLLGKRTIEANMYYTIDGYINGTTTNVQVYFIGLTSGNTAIVQTVYIGDGSYLDPVIDNSYSEAHAENHGVIPVDGVCGKAGYFNNSYMIAPRPALGDDITIYFWAKFDAIATGVIAQVILQSRTASESTGLSIYQSLSVYRFIWRGDTYFFSGYTPPVNTWHHVCMKMNATTKVLKINGETKVTLTGTYGTTQNLASTIWSGLSGTGGTLSGNVLTGALDGLKIVPRYTTDDEDIGEYKARANLPKFYATADKWKTARNIAISDADETNTGVAVSVDGSENETLKLPPTIKANITGNASTASRANVRVSLRHGTTFFEKTWIELAIFSGNSIWTDGDNIYCSNGTTHYVLNKSTSTWSSKTWTGLTNFIGYNIWTDGDNIYFSSGATQYVLNKSTSTWSSKTWTGLTNFSGNRIWTDGDNIYYSYLATHYVLNKSTSTWSSKTWTGLTDFIGYNIWTDGDNIYYSDGTTQYVLSKSTSTWVAKIWNELTSFYGEQVWTDGDNIYFSSGATQYVLNKSTSTWSSKTWTGLTDFIGYNIWTDGDNIYYSYGTTQQYVLPATRHNYVDDTKYNSLFGTVTRCNCSTLSARFVFRNE